MKLIIMILLLTFSGCSKKIEENYIVRKHQNKYGGIFTAKYRKEFELEEGCHYVVKEGRHLKKDEVVIKCRYYEEEMIPFNGMLVMDHVPYFISDEKQLTVEVNEYELSSFDLKTKLEVVNISNQQIGECVFDYILPSSKETYFKVVFKYQLFKNAQLLENQRVILLNPKIEYLIPEKYIREEKKKLFVLEKDETFKEVKGFKADTYYKIHNGLKEHDELKEIKNYD